MILDALISETPGSDLIVKTVNGLLGHQTRGRWSSAQDNAFILIAMNRYFHTFESVTPDMVAHAVARPVPPLTLPVAALVNPAEIDTPGARSGGRRRTRFT